MAINIRRARTEELARAVASATGESMTSAIESALEERLDRLRREQDVATRLATIRAITVDTARRAPSGTRARDLQDDLYDDDGLPA